MQDLTYEVWNSANKKERIKLLTNVSGYMPPGHLSALVSLRVLVWAFNWQEWCSLSLEVYVPSLFTWLIYMCASADGTLWIIKDDSPRYDPVICRVNP